MTVTPTSRHLTASMVVIDPEARAVLLVHHNATGKWVFPGGHLDPDETLAECAVREVREETGLEVTIFDESGFVITGAEWHPSPWLTAAFPAPAKPHKGEPAHTHIDHLFIGTADIRLPLNIAEDEVASVTWVLVSNLSQFENIRAEVSGVARRALKKFADAGLL